MGSLDGKLQEAFAKLETMQKKQNFTFAIVTGNLFGANQNDETVHKLLNGGINVPLSTYFTVGTTPLPQPIVARIEQDEDVSFHRSTAFTNSFFLSY
jgi:hypothetical protein